MRTMRVPAIRRPWIKPEEFNGYDENFFAKDPLELDALWTLAKLLPRKRQYNTLYGGQSLLRRLQMPCYSATPNWRGSQNEKTNQWMLALDEAPVAVKSLGVKLSALAGKPVNYFSFVGYENEKDHIDWHSHAEDACRDARVFIVSLGAIRTFGLRRICDECRLCDRCYHYKCDVQSPPCNSVECQKANRHRKICETCNDPARWILLRPAHGSLITLSSEMNRTHEHAVLDDADTAGLRISINTKNIPLEDIPSAEEWGMSEFGPAVSIRADGKTEVVHCEKHDYDIFIGRRLRGFPESPFANRSDGDYEAYFTAKLRSDPAFVDQVLGCYGQRLGCWCKDNPKRDFSKCHGHIVAKWADRLFAKRQELNSDAAVREWLISELGTA